MRTKNILKTIAIAVSILAVLLPPAPQVLGQGTMSFDGQTPGTYLVPIVLYTESGIQISGVQGNGFALSGGSLSGYPENGSGYLHMAGGPGVKIGLVGGAYFNFLSFDIAESFTNVPGPVTVQVVGYHVMGQTVTNIFTTDGINDGTGPLSDFQHFFVDSQFQNIYRVDILGSPYALDNLILSNVPEPNTGSLALVGAGGAVAWSRFRRNRRIRQTNA